MIEKYRQDRTGAAAGTEHRGLRRVLRGVRLALGDDARRAAVAAPDRLPEVAGHLSSSLARQPRPHPARHPCRPSGRAADFAFTLVASIVPVVLLGLVTSYSMLLVCGFLVGIALASFAVGVSFVSPWYPASRQGYALGVYGAGNIGQAIASFGAPVVAGFLGYRWGFWAWGVLAAVVLVAWLLLARDAPRRGPPKGWADYLRPLARPRSWALSLFYFLTFGGFVAMALSLPVLLTEQFHLGKVDAGFRTAGFIALATACRPLGGVLSDRIGGTRILSLVFPITAVCALLMARPVIDTFTIGALGMAAAIGLGNGAVFKLVPEHFPSAVGSVTGLVGAAGGIGGFFPPLALGELKQQTGSYAPGFVCLALFSLLCLGVLLTRPRGDQVVAAS